MKNVILICGRAGSGKDTVAQMLKSFINNDLVPVNKCVVISNAQGVKDVATKYFNWNGEKDTEGRDLLINITNFGYSINKNFWELKTMEMLTEAMKLQPFTNTLIIPDFRYEVTYDFFSQIALNIKVIKVVNSRVGITHDDKSERDFEGFPVDYTVFNNGSMIDLKMQVSDLWLRLL